MNATFFQNPKGNLRVWVPPKLGRAYLIGADVGEGLEKGDYSAAHVIDIDSFEQCAVWWGKEEPYQFARELYSLGVWYNAALLAPERNKDGITVIDFLRANNYPRIYKMQKYDYETVEDSARLGWVTNVHTRPLMIGALREAVRNMAAILHDPETIAEMQTFVKKPPKRDDGRVSEGKIEASSGSFDDLVMSLAICAYLRRDLAASGYSSRSDSSYMDQIRARDNRDKVMAPGRGGY